MATLKQTIGASVGAALLAAGAGALVWAGEDHDKARQLKEAGEILPLEAIAERARSEQPGRIIEIELETKRDGHIYEVEIVDASGRVHELKYDAGTGELVKSETKDKVKEVADDILPLEVVANRALQVQAGRIAEIELENKRDRPIYEVKIVDEAGRTHKLELDARTGELLSGETNGERG
jgi:uncharacterized membrane protein YkoI